jgi:hypothetical protein
MRTSPIRDISGIRAIDVKVTEEELRVDLEDGRALVVPLVWYPRLVHGSPAERDRWRLVGRGHGIHWPDLDEDISVEGLVAGHRSAETQPSLARWLEARRRRRQSRRRQPSAAKSRRAGR